MTTTQLTATDTVERLLDLARDRADAAEVYFVSSESTPVRFENNQLKSLSTKASRGVALQVRHQGRLGFASSTDLSRLEELVEAAVETAALGSPAEYEFASQFHGTDLADPDYTPPSTDTLVETGHRLMAQVHDYNPDILVSVSLGVQSSQVLIATSSDVQATRSRQSVSASLGGNLVRGEDFLDIYHYVLGRDRTPDFDELVATVLRKYEWAARGQGRVQSGTCPVLFMPRAVASVFGGLFDTVLSGQTVVQKASPLADRLGQQVFNPCLTLYEDPTLGPSACTFDDEGTPTQATTYIDRGVVQGFYWDRRWAQRGGVQSTGNGFRGGISRANPDLVNLCIAPGQTSTADLIASMADGIIVDQVLGAGQSNQLAGEFSVNLDVGYKVEQGEIVGRIKDTMVAGSIFEAFDHVTDFGDRPEWIGGGMYTPSMLFSQLGVASRQG